jgi:hypothetical protein
LAGQRVETGVRGADTGAERQRLSDLPYDHRRSPCSVRLPRTISGRCFRAPRF